MPKTKITPKQLFERRNTTDVFNREVIIGLLTVLNKSLVYEQVWSGSDTDGKVESVTVPFFYDFGGSNNTSEKFIQDNYTFFTSDECTDIGLKKIDGNFDFYPQGRISLSGVSINSGDVTNRFSMYNYTKYIDGKLQTFVSYMYSMPLQFSFNIEVRAETMLTAFKIDQAYREYFYKNKTYHFNYKGTVISCRAGFPESAIQPTAGATYQMGTAPSDNYIKLSMNVQVETYQPVFDPYQERPADVSIGKIGSNIWVNNTKSQQPRRSGPIEFKTDFSDLILISGQELMIEWNYEYLDKDLMMVDICYMLENDDTEYFIETVENHNFYHWEIPYDFIENQRIDFIVPNTDYVCVSTPPEVYIYPDPKTKLVEPENVYIKNKGFFVAPSPDFSVAAVISYENRKGNIVEIPAKIHLRNFMIDPTLGIEFECFPFENDITSHKVKLIVKDHSKKENKVVSNWFTVI